MAVWIEVPEERWEALRADLKALAKALEPFAVYGKGVRAPDALVITQGSNMARRQLTIGDVKVAGQALARPGVKAVLEKVKEER